MPIRLSEEEKLERKRCAQLSSMLRRAWSRDPERYAVLNANTRPYNGADKRIKREHQCAICSNWFFSSGIQVDHIEPVGSFKKVEQLGEFTSRLFVYSYQLQKLCAKCHNKKTSEDIKKIRSKK